MKVKEALSGQTIKRLYEDNRGIDNDGALRQEISKRVDALYFSSKEQEDEVDQEVASLLLDKYISLLQGATSKFLEMEIEEILREKAYITFTTKKFASYEDFLEWYRNYTGKLTEKMKITIPNDHGENIIYFSPIEALEAHEE